MNLKPVNNKPQIKYPNRTIFPLSKLGRKFFAASIAISLPVLSGCLVPGEMAGPDNFNKDSNRKVVDDETNYVPK